MVSVALALLFFGLAVHGVAAKEDKAKTDVPLGKEVAEATPAGEKAKENPPALEPKSEARVLEPKGKSPSSSEMTIAGAPKDISPEKKKATEEKAVERRKEKEKSVRPEPAKKLVRAKPKESEDASKERLEELRGKSRERKTNLTTQEQKEYREAVTDYLAGQIRRMFVAIENMERKDSVPKEMSDEMRLYLAVAKVRWLELDTRIGSALSKEEKSSLVDERRAFVEELNAKWKEFKDKVRDVLAEQKVKEVAGKFEASAKKLDGRINALKLQGKQVNCLEKTSEQIKALLAELKQTKPRHEEAIGKLNGIGKLVRVWAWKHRQLVSGLSCEQEPPADLCAQKVCDDNNPCTSDVCDPATGSCGSTRLPSGASCSSTGGTCNESGQCVEPRVDLCAAKTCEDNNTCTTDRCDPATGSCVFSPLPIGTSCNSSGGTCNDAAQCIEPVINLCAGKSCDDGNPCTSDACDSSTGSCVFSPQSSGTICSPTGGACDASARCIEPVVDLCAAKTCADGNPCTIDQCNSSSGACIFTNALAGTTCSSSGGQCDGSGVCVEPKVDLCAGKTCNDNNSCTADNCDSATGSCVYKPELSGTKCSSTGGLCDASGKCVEPQVSLETITIKGRMLNRFTNQPLSNLAIRGVSGGVLTTITTTNANGEFSFTTNTSDMTTSTPRSFPYWPKCYMAGAIALFRTSDNKLQIALNLFDAARNTYSTLSSPEANLGDILMWPAVDINVASGIPVQMNIAYPEEGTSYGNILYKNYHYLSNVVPLTYDTRVKLTDQSGGTYYSPYTKVPLENGCTPAKLMFFNNEFNWVLGGK